MKTYVRIIWIMALAACLTSACQPAQAPSTLSPPSPVALPQDTATPVSGEILPATSAPLALVPDFSHIVIVIFENKEFETIVGNPKLPFFNLYANTFTLLTQHYATAHPSLPNYISLIGGDTFGITDDCDLVDCTINETSLPDLIEASGRTWKTYQDDMPEPCFTDSTFRYVKKHNPFIFFDPIRLDVARCKQGIVPLTQMDVDIASGELPNFIFITPDICYSSHDCAIELADGWMRDQLEKLYPALEADGGPFLVILTWDEGTSNASCCGLPEKAGGRVATVLISPQVKSAFQDDTPYSHYSILKTIAEAWGLPYLGHAADPETTLITAPWK